MKTTWHESLGIKYNNLTVISADESVINDKHRRVICLCDCGIVKSICLHHVKSGRTKSCGCMKIKYKHRYTEYKLEYQTWSAMMNRCHNPNASGFSYYGAIGISVCERWHNFDNFLTDVGVRPFIGATLDRIDNNYDYEPGNVKWATMKQQNLNKSNTKFIAYGGCVYRFTDLCELLGVDAGLVRSRVFNYNWSLETALAIPKGSRDASKYVGRFL